MSNIDIYIISKKSEQEVSNERMNWRDSEIESEWIKKIRIPFFICSSVSKLSLRGSEDGKTREVVDGGSE